MCNDFSNYEQSCPMGEGAQVNDQGCQQPKPGPKPCTCPCCCQPRCCCDWNSGYGAGESKDCCCKRCCNCSRSDCDCDRCGSKRCCNNERDNGCCFCDCFRRIFRCR